MTTKPMTAQSDIRLTSESRKQRSRRPITRPESLKLSGASDASDRNWKVRLPLTLRGAFYSRRFSFVLNKECVRRIYKNDGIYKINQVTRRKTSTG
ncbi:hypothetical protein PUN28_002645 [Cardiocondyla obscurior]|uniref:Uncharacterized protein n=1 Tax=Cardiocondyla obscurior TaxID=286306 RepID=A0AAW2GV95_9HYME